MESQIKTVVTSSLFDHRDIPSIFYYGMETFGIRLADTFIEELYYRVELLET